MSKGEEALKFNPADYDYMDALPLEGWIWEFIRRNVNYQKIYKEFERIKKEKDYLSFLPTLRVLRKTVAIRAILVHKDIEIDPELFLKVKMPKYELCAGIAKPYVKYSQFKELKPIIEGVTPVIPHKIESDKIKQRAITIGDKKVAILKNAYYVPKDYCCEVINEILPPVDVRNTLYVGVAMAANKDDVRESLESIIKHLIKPRDIRIKDEMWKDYLFIYDLKEKLDRIYKKITYKDITKILTENCPSFRLVKDAGELKKQSEKLEKKEYKNPKKTFLKRYPSARIKGEIGAENTKNKKVIIQVSSSEYFYEKNCERFYKKAQSLIKGEYKKYLYLK